MTSQDTATNEQAGRADDGLGRGYTVAGAVMAVALTIVAIAGLAGVAGPGLFSMGEGFFILGASALVLSIGVVGLFFSMHRTIKELRRQQAVIDQLQNERARAIDETQARTAQAQEAEIEELRAGSAGSSNDHGSKLTPFGDLHRVLDVQGIGRDFAGQLGDLDILDTEQLWQADAEEIAAQLDVRRKTVRGWQSMAELMALQHVGPQYAEILLRADVNSIGELADQNPAELASALQDVEDSREVRVQGNTLSAKHTRKWIEAAENHDPQGVRVERNA